MASKIASVEGFRIFARYFGRVETSTPALRPCSRGIVKGLPPYGLASFESGWGEREPGADTSGCVECRSLSVDPAAAISTAKTHDSVVTNHVIENVHSNSYIQ